ncbi:hypothetical protein DT065_16955 [Salicibibacter kimchii]|uniref:Uncharacterized protein n=1 Tax=Salicibibacter kimchii TaxID=2099786 RepID=A0A345C2S5_9BACI|nr:hypothetical protein DT065_16955 [Salicibibacter kimchii]
MKNGGMVEHAAIFLSTKGEPCGSSITLRKRKIANHWHHEKVVPLRKEITKEKLINDSYKV